MNTIITVTAEHIAQGKRGSGPFCPLALAFNEAAERKDAVVGYGHFSFLGLYPDGTGPRLPFDARRFINRFDEGETVEPFSFDIGGDLKEILAIAPGAVVSQYMEVGQR